MSVVKDIQEEGIDARNIVSWRVPNVPLASPSGEHYESTDDIDKRSSVDKAAKKSPSRNSGKKKPPGIHVVSDPDSELDSRSDFQNRLWRFLFSNISRAVDELYNLCEDEDNRDKCVEGIALFEQSKRDFEKLIERMDNQKQFESDPSAPKAGISWEIRKTSMGGKRHKNAEASAASSPAAVLTPPRSASSIRTEFSRNDKSTQSPLTPVVSVSSSSVATASHHPKTPSKLSAAAAPFLPQTYRQHIALALRTGGNGDACASPATTSPSMTPVECICKVTEANATAVASNAAISESAPESEPSRHTSLPGPGDGHLVCDSEAHADAEATKVIPSAGPVSPSPVSSHRTATPPSEPPSELSGMNPGAAPDIAVTPPVLQPESPPLRARSAWAKPIHIAVHTSEEGKLSPAPPLPTIDTSSPVAATARARRPAAYAPADEARSGEGMSVKASKIASVVANSHDDEEDDMEVVRESERVWAKTEAWVEAEIQAEEAAWNALYCVSSASSGASTPRRWSGDIHFSHSIFGLEVEVEAPDSVSGLSALSPSVGDHTGKFSPKRQATSEDSADYMDGMESETHSSPGSHRSTIMHWRLHEKLSSPARLTPEQARRKQEARQSVAELNRDKSVMERKQKAMVASNRVKASGDREAQRIAQAEQIYTEKLREAERRHTEYIESVRGKAGNENNKVSEVLFINSLNEGAIAEELQRNLAEAEARIIAGRKRRQDMLTGIRAQQRKRNTKKVEQMSELRLALAREKMERWEKIQHRLNTVQKRREERIAELQRRNQEAKEKADKLESTAQAATPLPSEAECHVKVNDDSVTVALPPTAAKPKKNKVGPATSSSGEDDMALLDKIIQSNSAAEQGDDSTASLQGAYVQTAFTKLQLNVQSPAAQHDRRLAMPQPACERKASTKPCLERGYALESVVSKIIFSPLVRLVLSSPQEGSIDTGTSSLRSVSSSSKRNKRRAKAKKRDDSTCVSDSKDVVAVIAAKESGGCPEEATVDVDAVMRRFDLTNSDHLKEFVDNGGITLCRFAFDTQIGCLSSAAAFREAAAGGTLAVLCRALQRIAKESEERAVECSKSEAASSSVGTILEDDPLEKIFTSGACVAVTDMVQYLLLSFQVWGNSHFPKVLSSRSHKSHSKSSLHNQKGGFSSYSKKKPVASGGNRSGSGIGSGPGKKSAKGSSSGVECSSGSAGSPMAYCGASPYFAMTSNGINCKSTSVQQAIDIKWPPQIAALLPSLLLVLSRLCQHCSRHFIAQSEGDTAKSTVQSSAQSQHWISYVQSSGLVESVGSTLRDVQCIAGNCCSDDVVFELLTELSSFVGHYFTLLRLYRSAERHASAITLHLSDICASMTDDEESNGGTGHTDGSGVESLWSSVSATLAESEMAMHLIALLGTLLLQDIAPKRSGASYSPVGGMFVQSPPSAGVNPVPPPVTVLSHEILKSLNTLCRYDLRAVQHLPLDLQALSAHVTERLFNFLFAAMDSPTDNAAARNISMLRKANERGSSRPALIGQELAADTYESVVEQLLVYLGYLCLDCPANQEFVSRGTPPCLLVRCCNLPVRYISDERLKLQFIPTLLSFCHNNKHNLSAMKQEMSPQLLTDLLLTAQTAYSSQYISSGEAALTKSSGDAGVHTANIAPSVADLAMRFPVDFWGDALDFLEKNK